MMALPTEPPYCLMYPTVYDDNMKDKTLFPKIAEPCNHCWSLVDLNTGEPYPMEVVGNFCLKDSFFPGCLGDSLVFRNSELTEIVGQGYHIHTYQEKAVESTGSSKTHQSPHSKVNSQKPPRKDQESSKPGGKTLGTSSPQILNSTSTSKTSSKLKHSPPPKNERISMTRRSIHLCQKGRKTNMTVRTATSPPSPRSHPTVRKTTSEVPTRTAATLPVKGMTSTTLFHVPPHLSTTRKRPTSTAPSAPQVKVHVLGTQAPLEA